MAKMRRIGYMVMVFKKWNDYSLVGMDGEPAAQLQGLEDSAMVGFCPVYEDRSLARAEYPGHRIEPITIGFTDNEEDEHGS